MLYVGVKYSKLIIVNACPFSRLPDHSMCRQGWTSGKSRLTLFLKKQLQEEFSCSFVTAFGFSGAASEAIEQHFKSRDL